jgi:hypothetical protein
MQDVLFNLLERRGDIMRISKFTFSSLIMVGIIFITNISISQETSVTSGVLGAATHIKTYTSNRLSSFSQTGHNDDWVVIDAGQTKIIAEIEGSGIIKHIWITLVCPKDPMIRRNAILRMYWDGEENPSVESPLGDFFGNGWGEEYNFKSMPLAVAPKAGRALNCYFQMPFSNGAKITLENQSDESIPKFYFYIDYESHKIIPKNMGRFHAWWNRELTEPLPGGENEWSTLGPQDANIDGSKNYMIADIEGRGHFIGVNYYVDSPTPMWYGEGDDMFFIDGEAWPPSLHGTGTEDFFNSSWCPKEIYMHPYFGYPRVNDNIGYLGRTHCYRFLLESPINFNKSCRATIEHGHNNCMTLDLCTVAYWYQTEPHKPFPKLPPKEQRQNMKTISPADIHIWRDAWRKSKGEGVLWGNEK